MKPVLELELSMDDLEKLQVGIIVEAYNKAVGREASGSNRRKYKETFTKEERDLISYYYNIFYRWIMVTGTPNSHRFKKAKNIQLIQRAVEFFAQC